MTFLFLVALSLLFRVTFLQAIEFKADEATSLFLATRPLFDHPFLPASSVSSFGILNPPLFLYTLFPLVLLSTDPRFLSACIGILNAFTVGLFYLLIKRYYGKHVSLITSLFLAVSPWAILFSRKIWAQDFILPLSLPLFYAFHKIRYDKDKRFWLPYAVFSLLLIQVHQALLFFLVPFNLFLFLTKPRVSFRHLLLGIFFGIIPALPWVYYEMTHGLPTLDAVSRAGGRVENGLTITHLLRPFQILHTGNWFFIMGNDIAEFAAKYPLLFRLRPLFYLYYPLLLFGMFIFWRKHTLSRPLLYATLCLPVLYALLHIPPHMHYFIVLLPLLFLFIAIGIQFLSQKFPFAKFPIIGTIYLGIVFLSFFNILFLQFTEKKGSLSGDYGTSYGANEKLAKRPLEKYRKTKKYQEMLLATYVPLGAFRGDTIIASMVYDPKSTKKRLSLLDNQFKSTPEDARIKHELLAYYTTTAPREETLVLLRQKSKNIPSYSPIYSAANAMHLEKTLRKAFEDPMLGIALEFPKHWDLQKTKNQTIITGDGFILSLQPINTLCTAQSCVEETEMLSSQTVEKMTCVTKENMWCGIVYGPIHNTTQQFFITYKPDGKQPSPFVPSEEYTHATALLKSILDSLRQL
ncbi:MAG: glycosyltransferase family 39 protein [Candidatus Levybacteria bacterium]|nr:glycosyltransferase family 39 protein [Candidatus Levybacteria bacterium]